MDVSSEETGELIDDNNRIKKFRYTFPVRRITYANFYPRAIITVNQIKTAMYNLLTLFFDLLPSKTRSMSLMTQTGPSRIRGSIR
jgi:hypothetical protein